MGKASSLSTALGLAAVLSIGLSTGCEQLIGSDFDKDFKLAGPGVDCYEPCPTNWKCNKATGECQCKPLQCGDPELPPHECGGALEPHCQQPIDCGTCPGGFECTNSGDGQANVCTPINGTPCKPQTCAELGQTSGVHFSCGVLVDCNAAPECTEQCSRKQVCTANGCCTPLKLEIAEDACGLFADGCGRIIEVACPGDGICTDGTCCTPSAADLSCDGKQCGFNATSCGLSLECLGSCGEGEGQCQDGVTHPFCNAKCEMRRMCPPNPVCGLNADGCGSYIECNGACPVATDACTSDFKCCTPRCPAQPSTCGANEDGCGKMIQCPGPCPTGTRCNSASDGTYACTP